MKCRRNIRKLIQEHNAATDKSNTELARFVDAILVLKGQPSRLPPEHTQASRYDDYVYVHRQAMYGHSHAEAENGPHIAHQGPSFLPWHREFLRQFELDLREASGDSTLCLPYWDFSRDRSPADPGYPFIDACLGGDGGPDGEVTSGPFTQANGWPLTVLGSGTTALHRELGQGDPSLPTKEDIDDALEVTKYDASPFNATVPPADSFRNSLEGFAGARGHNRVHAWIGGSMNNLATSPNDPAFFLLHCKVDNLWAVWAQKHPAVAHYLPSDGYDNLSSSLVRLSDHMKALKDYFGAGTLDRPIDLLDHKSITWYDTDLPDVVLVSGPALVFQDTPKGLKVAQRIRFRVKSCREVIFRVTGAPTGNFSVVDGPNFTVTPQENSDFEILEIEVRFHALGSNVQVNALDIEAHITDKEGYYAATANDSFTVGQFHIELVASNIITSDSSVVLVLDRSWSMTDAANSGFNKCQLLKSAVGVVHSLMKDNDQIGIARFDHEADVLLPMKRKKDGLGTTLTGPGLDPRGGTSVGGGILVGSKLINGPKATRPNKALIVLSDGNENVDPLVDDLPQGTINKRTFAIGFGRPGQVSDQVLDRISANTGGYLLVTGDMTNDKERFKLAKFFIQILKDATLNDTIVDPDGVLRWNGQTHEIPFPVADSDVSIDVVVLCPLPVALDFRLITPAGLTIKAADSAKPNVRYVIGQDIVYYRLMLPVFPNDPAGSHRGTWKAVLQLRKADAVAKDLGRSDRAFLTGWTSRLREFANKPLPFNLTVHSYSNLILDATLRRDSFAPGARVHLSARLWEYRVPLRKRADVWADVLEPDGNQATLEFSLAADGAYRADWLTDRPGIYQFTIRADGHTRGHVRFSREKVLTAGVWAGGDDRECPKPPKSASPPR